VYNILTRNHNQIKIKKKYNTENMKRIILINLLFLFATFLKSSMCPHHDFQYVVMFIYHFLCQRNVDSAVDDD